MILLSLCLSQAFADEGMWLLGNLRKNKQAERVMKELGLQMSVNKLYNPKKPALANAVVSFGGFCSGVVVSEDGLVFTNHHCGFSSIQQHSSVEHDYLKDGFDKFLYVVKHYGIVIAGGSIIVAVIVVIVVKNRYKHNGKAGTYDLKKNSKTMLTDKKDIFLTKHVSVTRIRSDSDSSGGSSSSSSGGGGSSGGGSRSF